jgi:hypothetical protein
MDGYILSQNELGSVDVLRRNNLTFGFEDMVEYPGPWNRPLGLTRGSLQTFKRLSGTCHSWVSTADVAVIFKRFLDK